MFPTLELLRRSRTKQPSSESLGGEKQTSALLDYQRNGRQVLRSACTVNGAHRYGVRTRWSTWVGWRICAAPTSHDGKSYGRQQQPPAEHTQLTVPAPYFPRTKGEAYHSREGKPACWNPRARWAKGPIRIEPGGGSSSCYS